MSLSFLIADMKQKILPLKQRAELHDTWLTQRLEQTLKPILQREKLDMWVVTSREYNDDPVILSLTPAPTMSPRRRTLLVFFIKPDGSLERLNLSRYSFGSFYTDCWDPARETQFECLGRIVRERNPSAIGLNYSDTFAFGDGLSHSSHVSILQEIGDEYAGCVRSAERVAVGWLEQRIQPELVVYPAIVQIGHAIIAEAFSSRVIHPGLTTTTDVVWWMREKMLALGVDAWFQPSIELQGFGGETPTTGHHDLNPRILILPGDMLHCDMGFAYLDLTTDQQELAYVLKPGETDAPAGLKAGLADGNRLQDIHMQAMQIGKTGNQALQQALEQARSEAIDPMIYTHPLGFHGHGAGPLVGLWDFQNGVPGSGDYEFFDKTSFSIELNVKKAVPEWDNQMVVFALEQDAVMDGGVMRWIDGRQTEFHLIG